MENINFQHIITHVQSHIKKSYVASFTDGKLTPNVANFGGNTGNIVKIERSGIYNGIAVELLQDVKMLLTDHTIIRVLNMLKSENYVTPLEILKLRSLDELEYILHKWLLKAVEPTISAFNNYKTSYPIHDKWINTVRYDALAARIKVVEIGFDEKTGNSVVPITWLDRIFDSGKDLHLEMDKLETRIGQPPVTYAITYAMQFQSNEIFIDTNHTKFKYVCHLDYIDGKIIGNLVSSPSKKYSYVLYGDVIIGLIINDFLICKTKQEKHNSSNKIREVGLLVSRLQKSIRRGRYGAKILAETIDALNECPNYNLPEHGFMRVSASKQLVWRLFITIIEDCRPYTPIDEPGLFELVLLTLITQKLLEYKFQPHILHSLKKLALLAQYNDNTNDLFDWRSLPETQKKSSYNITGSTFHNAISLVLSNIIMMKGDNLMLRKYFSVKNNFKFAPFQVPEYVTKYGWDKILSNKGYKYLLNKSEVYDDIALSSYDPHCKTHIILYYQACIPISLTTKEISKYIWQKSSSYNIRNSTTTLTVDPVLRSIQKYFLDETMNNIDKQNQSNKRADKLKNKSHLDSYNKYYVNRATFLTLFGSKYRNNRKEIMIAGTDDMPLRVKQNNIWVNSNDIELLNAFPKVVIGLSDIDPPYGYAWNIKKAAVEIINGRPIVNNQEIPFFDASIFVDPIKSIIKHDVDNNLQKIILNILSGIDVNFKDLLKFRNSTSATSYRWIRSKDIKLVDKHLMIATYTKLFNQVNNIITIGPVSRSGEKMHNSIDYKLEGKIWAIFNLLHYIYPDTFKIGGALSFTLKKNTSGYVDVINNIRRILFAKVKIDGIVPIIKTKLWDHQLDSVNKIITGFQNGKYGFGDASDVGSGKTLTSLTIATRLIKSNDETYSGILVLLPGNNLIKTWKDEIERHTQNFSVIYQKNKDIQYDIKRNTIVVTTLARSRDYPIRHNWLLVIIDECLSVQNKNAFWTQNAWCQSMLSKYLIMMSATFFRTRFDKLYYMLKMLRSGLPERREYLDTILSESIVSHINNSKVKWSSDTHYFILDDVTRSEYTKIENSNLDTEAKYSRLNSLLYKSVTANKTLIKQLKNMINNLADRRCLLYARSMPEAISWSNELNIPIYPKKATHCIVTYNDGTYGLNDLVEYDTIVMRPPAPDKLPQIKGRLDRPGQLNKNLYINYFIFRDTIEEGLILRMNIASNFFQTYIMPLAEFYDISVNYNKYINQ